MPVQWTLLLFGLFAGIGLACLGIAALSEFLDKNSKVRRPLVVCSLVLMVVGGLCSFFHLNSPEHLFYVLGNLRSGITIELVLTGLSFAAAVLYLLTMNKNQTALRRGIAGLCLALAIVFPFSTGTAYSVMTARPAWASIFLPLMYLVSAWAGGLLVSAVLSALKEPAEKMASHALLAIGGLGAFAASIALWIVSIGTAPYQDYSRSVNIVMAGDYSVLFWGGVIALGVIAPIILMMSLRIRAKRSSCTSGSGACVAKAAAALLSFAAGSAVLRVIVYLLGTSIHSYIYVM